MRTLSALNAAAAISQVPWVLDFVKVTVDPSDPNKIVRLTNHYHDITFDGETYKAAGEFLGFGDIADNLEIKDNSLELSLSGVSSTFTAIFLDEKTEGSLVDVYRGYYDESTGTVVDTPEIRWSGRVNSSTISDDYKYTDRDNIVIAVNCKSLLLTMLDRHNGRYTSLAGFQRDNPGDLSMEFVAPLVNFSPSFGKDDG